MSKEKIIAFGKKHNGSILAYSLIVLAMMLGIATTLSISTIISKKSASGTEFSMQSLQTADSGVQITLKKIGAALSSDPSVKIGQGTSPVFTSCDNSGAAAKVLGNADGGPAGSTYDLTFTDSAGADLKCNDDAIRIANIKSVGTYKGTVRAVNVAVAASSVATQVLNLSPGGLPVTGAFSSSGKTVVVFISGTGYAASAKLIGMELLVDGVSKGFAKSFTNESSSHKAFSSNAIVISGLAAGTHTLSLNSWNSTNTDDNDFFSATVLEL